MKTLLLGLAAAILGVCGFILPYSISLYTTIAALVAAFLYAVELDKESKQL